MVDIYVIHAIDMVRDIIFEGYFGGWHFCHSVANLAAEVCWLIWCFRDFKKIKLFLFISHPFFFFFFWIIFIPLFCFFMSCDVVLCVVYIKDLVIYIFLINFLGLIFLLRECLIGYKILLPFILRLRTRQLHQKYGMIVLFYRLCLI